MPRINTEFVNRTNAPGEYRDDELKGFTLRIRETTSGGQVKPVKTYVVLRRIKGGGLVRYTIGRHGDCTVKQARDIAERVLLEMKQGIDPRVTEEKKRIEDATFRSQQKAVEKERGLTLRVVFESHPAHTCEPNQQSACSFIERFILKCSLFLLSSATTDANLDGDDGKGKSYSR